MIIILLIIIGLILLILIYKVPEKENYVNALVAKHPIDIQRGLMYLKKPLPENNGMLFDFGREKNNKIWMKNTFIPLDIIFLDNQMKVLGFVENAAPLKEKLLGIDQKSRYVLEMNGGWAMKNEIKKGKHIKINKIKKFKEMLVN